MAEVNWSDAQWQKVNDCVTAAFGKASVAGAFLPCYGPLPASVETVRDEELKFEQAKRPTVTVADDKTLKLFNLRVKVELSSEQVADESLSSALLAFQRAANVLAQVEDDIVFNGYEDGRENAKRAVSGVPDLQNSKVVATGPASLTGLVNEGTGEQIVQSAAQMQTAPPKKESDIERLKRIGQNLVAQVADAMVSLESDYHPGPFACILGSDLFTAAHTPTEGLVLPADRIRDILSGRLLRSGRMGKEHGVVVSLATSSIDIVVATPPKVQLLNINEDAKYVFRVYEKFILRIKDPKAVRGIGVAGAPEQQA
jgi:uncharacterized linocin/CFP29 family protein